MPRGKDGARRTCGGRRPNRTRARKVRGRGFVAYRSAFREIDKTTRASFAFSVGCRPVRPTPRRARSDGRGREGGVSGRWGGCRDRTSPGTRNVASGVRRARDGGPDRRVDGERGSASVGASVLDLERDRHVRVRRRVSFPPPHLRRASHRTIDRPAARLRHAQSPAAARRGPLPFPARRSSREQRIVRPAADASLCAVLWAQSFTTGTLYDGLPDGAFVNRFPNSVAITHKRRLVLSLRSTPGRAAAPAGFCSPPRRRRSREPTLGGRHDAGRRDETRRRRSL